MELFCPSEVKEWWEDKKKTEKGQANVTAIQVLMSHIFLGVLRNALSSTHEEFEKKCAIVLGVLSGDTKITYVDSQQGDMMGGPNENIDNKKTFH